MDTWSNINIAKVLVDAEATKRRAGAALVFSAANFVLLAILLFR